MDIMRRIRFVWLGWLLAGACLAHAQSQDVSDLNPDGGALQFRVMQAEHLDRGLSPPDIASTAWESTAKAARTIGFSSDGFWIHARVMNGGAVDDVWWIQLSKPFTDELTCHVDTSSGRYFKVQTGDAQPFGSRLVSENDYLLPMALAAGEQADIRCLIRNNGATVADLRLWKPEVYRRQADKALFYRSIAYGGLLFALISAGVLAWMNRDKVVVLLAIDMFPIVAATMALEGDSFRFIWPDWPGLNIPVYQWLLMGLAVEVKVIGALIRPSARERRVLNGMVIVALFLLGLTVLVEAAGPWLTQIILPGSTLFGLILAWMCAIRWRYGALPRFLVVGELVQLGGLLINALGVLGVHSLVPAYMNFQLASLYSGLIKASMLLIVVAVRYRAERRAKAALQAVRLKDLEEKLNFQKRIELMLSRHAVYGAPNQQAFQHALQMAGQHEVLTVVVIRLNRWLLLQPVLSPDVLGRAVREMIDALEMWLRAGSNAQLLRVGSGRGVAAIDDMTLGFALLGPSQAGLPGDLETFLTQRHHTQGLYLAWDPMIGVSTSQQCGQGEEVLWQARLALNWCTPHRRTQQFRSDRMSADQWSNALTLDLEGAVRRGELELHYQPKVTLSDGSIESMEALVRWRHPVRGMIPPGAFIAEAEATGAIHQLTMWAFAAAAQFLKQLDSMDLRVAINVTAFDIETPGFCDKVIQVLDDHGMTGHRFIVEVTESVAVSDMHAASTVLSRLRDAGFLVALDDFGSGYSSLGVLQDLPLDEIKVDRALVMGVETCPRRQATLSAMMELGRSLGLKVTVEGVESVEVLDWLRRHGCHVVQGYVFSKPLPVDQVIRWLHAGKVSMADECTDDSALAVMDTPSMEQGH